MNPHLNRNALAALSVLSLAAVLTACGGSDTDKDTDSNSKPEEVTASPTVTPMKRLAQLMVTKADLGGDYDVKESSLDGEFVFAKSQDEVTLSEPLCAPLAYAMNQLPLADPQAFLTDTASKNVLTDGSNYITLAAYEGGKAESAMTGLSEAVKSCGGGFSAKANDNTSAYESVAAEDTAMAGDESLGFKATMSYNGVTHTLHGAAVRSDDVVAVYFSVNGAAIADSKPSDAKIPRAILTAQNAKLG
ncbi:hypothetical protein [Streptomyces sp. NPDC001530]|uniref:hypothetical protein n=1 Tax=Streptomyces sp. NPDC001530 TaxID=3364582 RepID=UPI00369F30FE